MASAAITVGMRGTSLPANRSALASSNEVKISSTAPKSMNSSLTKTRLTSTVPPSTTPTTIAETRLRPERALIFSVVARTCASMSARAASNSARW
jgi:hypothetical protein